MINPSPANGLHPARRVCVYDTNLYLQAILNPNGPAAQALGFLEAGVIHLYLSPRLRSEVEQVLFRAKLRDKFPKLADETATALLDRLDSFAFFVVNPPVYFTLPRDPKDEPFINRAIHVRADYLVSRDNDLLHLSGNIALQQSYPFLRILDPVTFCAAMSPPKTD